jgi:polo-like kinase 4
MRDSNKVFSEFEAANIIKQVLDGLLYLHSQHILHRDMSLANLLLTKEMNVKIADFGLATQLTRPDEKHMTLCGTPNYISPEVASRASHGLPADVWSLGCMLYTLLVGRPPFDTDGIKSTLTRVVISNYTVPHYLSIEAKDLIDKLLQKNPSDRIKLEDVLLHPFMTKNTKSWSGDSGIMTISSASSQRSNFVQSTPFNGRFPVINEHEKFSNYSSMHDKPQIPHSDFFSGIHHEPPVPTRFTNKISLLQKCNSVELMDKYNINKNSIENMKSSPITSIHHLHAQINNMNQHQAMEVDRKPTTKTGLDVPPLNSSRLLATRHKTKNAILSIQNSGEVVIEFIKHKSRYKEDRVVDVCRISSDGLRVVLYQPEPGQ